MGRDIERAQRRGIKLVPVRDVNTTSDPQQRIARWECPHCGKSEVIAKLPEPNMPLTSGYTCMSCHAFIGKSLLKASTIEGETMPEEPAERVYVQRIETNLKRQVAADLGRKVLVIGKNGTGKSAFIDAYALGTTGQAKSPGLGKGKTIAARGSADERPAYVELTLSTGEVVTWPNTVSPVGSDTTSLTRDALFGQPSMLQSLILRGMPDVGLIDDPSKPWNESLLGAAQRVIPRIYTSELITLINTVKTGGEFVGAAAAIDRMLEVIASDRRACTSQIRSAKHAEQNVSPLSVTESKRLEELEAISAIIPDLDIERYLVAKAAASSELTAALAAAQSELSATEGRETATASVTGRLRAAHATMTALRPGLAKMNEWNAQLPAGTLVKCPCCGIDTTPETLLHRQAALGQAIAQAEHQLQDAYQRDERIKQLSQQVQDLDISIRRIKNEARRVLFLRGNSPHAIMDELSKLRARRTAVDAAVDAKAAADLASKRHAALSAIKNGLETIRFNLASDVLDVATGRINRLLPPRLRASLRTWGSRGEGCLLDVSVDGGAHRPYRMLGGAEKSIVGAAVAAAFASRGGVDAIIIDDIWLDRPRTTDLISLINEALAAEHGPGQAIISVVEYAGTIPDDWTVVRCEETQQGDSTVISSGQDVAQDPPPPPTIGGNGTPELLGTVERGELYAEPVPVYFLGTFARFTAKQQRALLTVPELPAGSLGVALSGEKFSTKVVAVVNDDVKLAVIPQNVATEVENLVNPKRTEAMRLQETA